MLAPVRRRDDFDALSGTRARGRSGPLRVARAPLPDHDDPSLVRVAYGVPRAVGSAVVRNRIRRRLRAMIADLAADGAMAPGLYLIGARSGAEDLTADRLHQHLVAALAALSSRSRQS